MHDPDEIKAELWNVALAIGCEPGDYGDLEDVDVLSVITDQVRWNVQERERLNAAPAFTPAEVGTMLAAIVHGATMLDGSSLTLLESAEQKLRAMYGLPTGPA